MNSQTALKALRYTVQPGISFIQQWARPLMTYGAGAAVLGIYIIDWRMVATRIPIYNRKFKDSTIE